LTTNNNIISARIQHFTGTYITATPLGVYVSHGSVAIYLRRSDSNRRWPR